MAHKNPKKGPHHVTTTRKPRSNEELERQELETEINAFISRAHGAIQDAREKMTDEEVAKADKEAEAILKAASDSAKSSRRSA